QSASSHPAHRASAYKSALQHLRVKAQGKIRGSVNLWSLIAAPTVEDDLHVGPEPAVAEQLGQASRVERDFAVDNINRITGVTKERAAPSLCRELGGRRVSPMTATNIAEIKARHAEQRKKWGD